MQSCPNNTKGGYVPKIVSLLNKSNQYNCQICGTKVRVIIPEPKYLETEHLSDLFKILIQTEDGCFIRA